ncbi:MAG: type II secretion system inner membrane protein GspF [Proteobacteria bacterium]|nr:type II secretion system inner membrane protein GspF [Pseudomonadota bacterium]
MGVFQYTALDAKGKNIKGIVDAENARIARLKLKQQGIFPTQLQETDAKQNSPRQSMNFLKKSRSKSVDTATLGIATRQLATLVGAGMPLVEAMRALSEQIDHQTLKQVITEVTEQVNEGSTLASSLKRYPKAFPKLYANMIASGETSGTLEIVLNRLAELLESQTALRRKVTSAMIYPALMITLCFGVIILLLTYVVPQITQIFASKKAALPLPTEIVIEASNFLKNYWYILLGLLSIFILWFNSFKNSEKGKRQIDIILLRLPIIGNLNLKIATSRFAKNLGTMLESGIELLTALATVKNIIGNIILEEVVEEAIEGVREGGSLSVQLDKSKKFPTLLIRMIAVGEKTGQLQDMLLRAATSYENEVNAIISGFTAILEPVLILILAVIVGGVLAAVMLPMLEMTSLAGV